MINLSFITTFSDDCMPNPCENGGTCCDLVDDYRCECADGYSGSTCGDEISK